MRILQRNLKLTTDTLLFIYHTTNVLLFKCRCNIFIGVTVVKEMPGSVASGTPSITFYRKGIYCLKRGSFLAADNGFLVILQLWVLGTENRRLLANRK
jgi:hypothetical protein